MASENTVHFEIGQQASYTRTIRAEDVEQMAALIGDRNPLHMDETFARQSRFGRRIAHGVFAAGLISAVLGNHLPGPGAIYLSQHLDFRAPVYLGDTVTARVEVRAWRPDKRIITLDTECVNQEGVQIAAGKAVLMMDTLAD